MSCLLSSSIWCCRWALFNLRSATKSLSSSFFPVCQNFLI
nr:MAG TPA: hypothetical protein [Caudoviricetes sp.]